MEKIIKFLFIGFIAYALLGLLWFLVFLMFEYSDDVRDEDEVALSTSSAIVMSDGNTISIEDEEDLDDSATDYERACKKLDFEAAHKIVDELRKEKNGRDDFRKALDYVYTAEVSYLLNTFPIEDSRPKILFLLQECDNYKWPLGEEDYFNLYEKICTLIISSGNCDLAIEVVRTLANTDRGNYYYKCFETVYKAVADNFVKSYIGKESVAKIAKMMQSIPVEGRKITANGVFYDKDISDYEKYSSWCTRYNRVCDHILTLAINNNNNDLAKAALLLYREEVDFIRSLPDDGKKYQIIEGVQVPAYEYYGKLHKESFNEAKKNYDQSVALGIFTE